MDRDEVEVDKNAIIEQGKYPAILTKQAWSIKDYGQKITPKKIAADWHSHGMAKVALWTSRHITS